MRALVLFQLCTPLFVYPILCPTHEPQHHMTLRPKLSFLCVHVCHAYLFMIRDQTSWLLLFLVLRLLFCSVGSVCVCVCTCSTTYCLFFYFSCIITCRCSSALHSVHGVLGSSVWVCLCVYVCDLVPYFILIIWLHVPWTVWWMFPECCNFFLQEFQEFCMWCWGGTHIGPKGFGYTHTEIH